MAYDLLALLRAGRKIRKMTRDGDGLDAMGDKIYVCAGTNAPLKDTKILVPNIGSVGAGQSFEPALGSL